MIDMRVAVPGTGAATGVPRRLHSGVTMDFTDKPVGLPDLSALSDFAPQLAAMFVSVDSDIALVIDDAGIIRNLAVGRDVPAPMTEGWVGRSWADTVTGDTRRKIEKSLQEVQHGGISRRHDVNHRSFEGLDIPVAYAAIRLGQDGPVIAVGRDLRAIAAIQQRVVDSQRDMERNYWQLRQAEQRYRMLFQVATDAVMVVDALSLNIVEANRAAGLMYGTACEALVGQDACLGIDRHSRAAVEELLTTARATGHAGEIRARLRGGKGTIHISATPFRGESALLLLVRARQAEAVDTSSDASAHLAHFVEHMPDAVVIADSSGRVIMTNRAFLDLFGLASESQVKGQRPDDWSGAALHDIAAVLGEVRHAGMATQMTASLEGPRGSRIDVEISAVLIDEGDQECVGLTFRRLGDQGLAETPLTLDLTRAIADLTGELGRRTLPDLVAQAASVAERHLLKAGLDAARGDRPQTARTLGVSIEHLESRLLQHGLPERHELGGPQASTLLN
jgi:transcriptional regulator PpsR